MLVEINQFISTFTSAVDFQNPQSIQPTTELATLPEWDSLAALGVIVMFDMEYGVSITADDLKNAKTIENLYALLAAKRPN